MQEKLQERKVFAEQVLSPNPPSIRVAPATEAALPPMFKGLSKPAKTSAAKLLTAIKESGSISWDEDTREVLINGKRLEGSDISKLVGEIAVNPRNIREPVQHQDIFLQALHSAGVPEDLIKNQERLARYAGYKSAPRRGGEDSPARTPRSRTPGQPNFTKAPTVDRWLTSGGSSSSSATATPRSTRSGSGAASTTPKVGKWMQ